MTLDDKEIAQLLDEVRTRIERADYDDWTDEEVVKSLQQVLSTGDDITYVLDQAIERLGENDD